MIANPEEAARAGANGQLIHKTVLLLVAVALIIGGIGVTNTMAMAVLERARELALMSAVGWSPRQVGGLVLAEGIAVSIIGAGVGLLLGVLGAGGLTDALGVSNAVRPEVTRDEHGPRPGHRDRHRRARRPLPRMAGQPPAGRRALTRGA